MEDRIKAYRRYSLVVLGYVVLVVLWGAYVRATGSGGGCGGHWPLCNGDLVPRAPAVETRIEYTHRLMSLLALSLVGVLIFRAIRLFPSGHRARRFAALSGVFLVAEALLGAGLVLFNYVTHDASVGRVFYLAAHLSNTLILLAVLALTRLFACEAPAPLTLRGKPKLLIAAMPAALLLCITGALAALGDTLLPAMGSGAALHPEPARSANAIVQLRLIHPPMALFIGALLLLAVLRALKFRPTPQVRTHAFAVMGLVFAELIAGMVNIVLRAPVWMQILHLLLAGLLWIVLVTMTALAFSDASRAEAQPAR